MLFLKLIYPTAGDAMDRKSSNPIMLKRKENYVTVVFLIRQLNKLRVDSKIISLYYNSMVSSVLNYVIGSWYYLRGWKNASGGL